MERKFIYTLLMGFLFLVLVSLGQTRVQNSKVRGIVSARMNDTSVYAILPFDTKDKWLFNNAQPANLTTQDINEIEHLIKKCLEDYNLKQKAIYDSILSHYPGRSIKIENFIIDLANYKRQYLAVLNEKGEKEVWINCFCKTHSKDWKKSIIRVRDGGNCYFTLKINLTLDAFYSLQVNDDL